MQKVTRDKEKVKKLTEKRYGFVYVDREEEEGATLDRYKKDSFYWYQDVIKQDGENLFKE